MCAATVAELRDTELSQGRQCDLSAVCVSGYLNIASAYRHSLAAILLAQLACNLCTAS